MTATAHQEPKPVPPVLYFDLTGEKFEFQTSAHTGDGVFRFRWTLGPGRSGPPEHVHEHEEESFAVVSGTLRIWTEGTPRDLGPGDRYTMPRGTRHRFLNPGNEPVVVEVSLDGTRMEDTLVPIAVHLDGRRKLTLGDFLTVMAHQLHAQGSQAPSLLGGWVLAAVGRLAELLGGRALPSLGPWHAPQPE